MAIRLAVECGNNLSLEQLLKLAIRNVDCGEAVTCENSNLSIWQLLKQAITVDDDGNYALNVCGCSVTDFISLTPQADPPTDPTEGMVYADTDHHLYYFNGTTWLQLDNAP